jgi:hypothetical protein
MALPSKVWDKYEADLRQLGEHRGGVDTSDGFLESLNLVGENGQLTESGKGLFNALFVAPNPSVTHEIMHGALLQNTEALAVCQALYGVPNVGKQNAESALRAQQLGDGLTDRRLGTLLTILGLFGVISYKRGQIEILDPPINEGVVPASVFISRETPFSNTLWMTRVLRECKGHVYWIDKHFQPGGLEMIADAADGNRVSVIRVLSLQLEGNSSSKTRKKYHALKQELQGKGIAFEWRFIDSTLVKSTHDRWLIGENTARNVPDVGTVLSGNHSEITKSDHADRLNEEFEKYWPQGKEFE